MYTGSDGGESGPPYRQFRLPWSFRSWGSPSFGASQPYVRPLVARAGNKGMADRYAQLQREPSLARMGSSSARSTRVS